MFGCGGRPRRMREATAKRAPGRRAEGLPDALAAASGAPQLAGGSRESAAVSETIFDLAAEKLEMHSDLDKLEARGTLRIALKTAGLEANALSIAQLEAVMDKIMPGELERRGVWQPESVCKAVMADVKRRAGDVKDAPETGPDSVFRRLGSD
jgi:hypothetical protein